MSPKGGAESLNLRLRLLEAWIQQATSGATPGKSNG
jgi:hypothetical protein